MFQDVDWVKVGSFAWGIFLTVLLPILAKRYALVRQILDVVVRGVETSHEEMKKAAEKADVDPRFVEAAVQATKDSIKATAEAAGVQTSLAPIVAKATEDSPGPPPPLPRIGALLLLVAMGAVSGCCSPSQERLAALDAEIATLTSVALTVDWFPSSKDLSGKIFMDRTEDQKKRIAEDGVKVRDHVHELLGVK